MCRASDQWEVASRLKAGHRRRRGPRFASVRSQESQAPHTTQHHSSTAMKSHEQEGWNVPASRVARDTHNPIRAIVENLNLSPNPDKPMIALSIGECPMYDSSTAISLGRRLSNWGAVDLSLDICGAQHKRASWPLTDQEKSSWAVLLLVLYP